MDSARKVIAKSCLEDGLTNPLMPITDPDPAPVEIICLASKVLTPLPAL
jgi:hypothetical protein